MSGQSGLKERRDEEDLNGYPEDVKKDFAFVWGWLTELAERYRERIRIELINASSFRGFYKSIRHWTQTYPTFIVNNEAKYTGRDKSELDRILQNHLEGEKRSRNGA